MRRLIAERGAAPAGGTFARSCRREASAKLARRHYDRLPQAGLKGDERHPKPPREGGQGWSRETGRA